MGVFALNFKTRKLVMYRQWGCTIHPLQLPKCFLLGSSTINPSSRLSSVSLSRSIGGLGTSVASARERCLGRSPNLSSGIII